MLIPIIIVCLIILGLITKNDTIYSLLMRREFSKWMTLNYELNDKVSQVVFKIEDDDIVIIKSKGEISYLSERRKIEKVKDILISYMVLINSSMTPEMLHNKIKDNDAVLELNPEIERMEFSASKENFSLINDEMLRRPTVKRRVLKKEDRKY